jgi:hypothetical protein
MNAIVNAGLSLAITVAIASTAKAAPPSSTAKGSEWIPIAQNSDDSGFFSGKRGSFEMTTTKAGESVAMLLGQFENKKNKSVSYSKWYVSAADCDAGLGKFVVLKINGDFDFERDFVAKGNNIASVVADFICALYEADRKVKQGKGV